MSQQGGFRGGQTAPVRAPMLRTARFEDYAHISGLQARHLSPVVPEALWRGLFLDNPLWPRVGATWPIGWVLEDADGAVVGSISNIPSLYRWRGAELLCANGRGWVVDSGYRGYALWLMDEYYSQGGVDLFINTTVADWVTSVQLAYANKVPLGDWAELAFRPIRYRPVVDRGLELRGIPLRRVLGPIAAAALSLKDSLSARMPAPSTSVDIDEPRSFDRRFDDLWAEIVSTNPEMLLAERDHRTLNWHYSVLAARGDLYILTASRAGALRAYCILKRQPRAPGVRSVRLVDFQSAERDIDMLSPLVHAAAVRCAAEGIHMIEHLGCGIPKMQRFDRTAPYRLRSNWRFFYQASDPQLAEALGLPEAWDPSEFDGDASYA